MENPSSSSSSSTSSSSPNSSTSSSSNNGVAGVGACLPPPPPPLTPKSASSVPPPHSSNPYPTTFVQADTQSFKQMVQLLTGSAETAAKRPPAPKNPIPPLNPRAARKPAFKLHERRPSMKGLKMISPFDLSRPTANQISPSSAAAAAARSPLSPSVLDFPSLALSPVTPLIPDPFDRPPRSPNRPDAAAEERRAIAEKGFYLHPSPRPATPRDAEPPTLLPLFPLASPRGSSA